MRRRSPSGLSGPSGARRFSRWVEGSGSSPKRSRKRNLLGSIATRFGSSPRCVADRDHQDNRDNRDGLVEVVLASPRGPAEPVTPSPYCPRLPTKKIVTRLTSSGLASPLTSHVSRLTPCLTNSPAPASPEDSKRLRLSPKFTATTVANMVQFPWRKFPVDGRGLAPTFAAEPTAMRIPTQSNNSCEVLRAYPTGAERIAKVTPLPCGLTPLYLGYCHLNVLEGSFK